MQFDTTYLTEAGRSLATGTLGGLDKIQFTRAVASSHDYSATSVNDLKKLTSIEDVQQTVEYSRIIKKDDTTLTMRVDFPSKDVTTAYSLYTVGFYARPENGDEILYGVLPSSLPDYIAAYDGKSNLNDSFQTDTTVSDADNVLITVSQAGSLNEADLDAIFASKHIATIDDIKANIPATVIDGSKPADFKEAVTLEKGAVDGAGNAIATTKNLADGDATTLKSAKEYADTQASDKVKTSDIDPSVMVKTTLTATDDVLNLDYGSYTISGPLPKNAPDLENTGINWGVLVVHKTLNGANKTLEYRDVKGNVLINILSGKPLTWSGWHIPNENSVVKDNGDDTVSINGKSYVPANAANVVDRNPDTGTVSKPTDFTNLTVNGGKSVATRDDLKSLREGSWLSLGTPLGDYLDITSSELVDTTFTGEPLFMKFDSATGTTKLSGGLLFSPIKDLNGHATWTGKLVTLPDGFDVSDDDVKSFITLLLNSNSTASTTLDSVTKSGQVISGTITYTGTPSGFKEGISLVGSVGANYRQYVTNLTTKLIKKI